MTYEPRGFALEIFKKRYALHDAEGWYDASRRVANHVATAENGSAIAEYANKFYYSIADNLFMPGGRIWYGAGRPKGQLMNCFVIPTDDSREGWGDTAKNMIIISGTGGGLGVNFSPIRPRNSVINGSGGVATGSTSLMEIMNSAGDVIKAGGGRRVAMMFALRIGHGDIIEFLDKKLDLNKLNNANVSVVFDEDPEIFFRKVKDDADFNLTFRGRTVDTVKARALWDRIIDNSLKTGEPGILNMYYANRMSNVWYAGNLICTNPCGEIWLLPFESCDLGAIVLPRFVDKKEIDWALLRSTVGLAVRFLDDVITINNYPIPEIAAKCKEMRRLGLGVMGLHDMLLMMGLKYNSDAGLELVDKVMGFIKNAAYEASIELAVEKGSFAAFDAEKMLKSGFIKTLKPSIRTGIRDKGMRNCALLTIAPTGTTSIVAGVTSGIESLFAPAYKRRYRDGDDLKEEIVVHPAFAQFVDAGRSVKHFQGAHDLKISDHFEMQRTCQKHIDNACSKTINVPKGTSSKELAELYMEYLPELKGVTVYPDGAREDQPLVPMDIEEAMKYVKSARVDSTTRDSCKDGKCDI